MVVVAHRLATVQNADVIFVLGEGGKLLEQGNHTELLKSRGVYWQMVSIVKTAFPEKTVHLLTYFAVPKPSAGSLIRQGTHKHTKSKHDFISTAFYFLTWFGCKLLVVFQLSGIGIPHGSAIKLSWYIL